MHVVDDAGREDVEHVECVKRAFDGLLLHCFALETLFLMFAKLLEEVHERSQVDRHGEFQCREAVRVRLINRCLVVRRERVPDRATHGEQVTRLRREGVRLGAVSKDRQVEDVAVGMGEHAQQVTVFVRLRRVRRMHHSALFEREVAQAEVDSDDGDDAEIARLDQADHRLRSLDAHWGADLDDLTAQLDCRLFALIVLGLLRRRILTACHEFLCRELHIGQILLLLHRTRHARAVILRFRHFCERDRQPHILINLFLYLLFQAAAPLGPGTWSFLRCRPLLVAGLLRWDQDELLLEVADA